MISSLRGRVLHLDAESAIIEVGGVGFSVAIPAALARSLHLGDDILLHTALIVREDALSLFGFADREELSVFHHLLSVSGVGPKSALGVLSALSVPQIADAVIAEDDAPFRRVSGIGPKTAKLIVVQLAGKLQASVGSASLPASAAARGDVAGQVVSALTALGWNERTSVEAVSMVVDAATDAERHSVPVLLKLALAQLGPARPERAGV